MNKQEFSKLWNDCILPSFDKLKQQDSMILIRDGSFDSLCRTYNDIKNMTKRQFMLNNNIEVILDRHKIAACLVKAILLDKPLYKKVEVDYTGAESNFIIVNEALAFGVALAMLRAYIELKLEHQDKEFMTNESAYRKICNEDFVFPKTIMKVDYPTSVCWAWHHNTINEHFDVLGTANLLFMIEHYSVQFYRAEIKLSAEN